MKRFLTAAVLIPIVAYVVLGPNYWVFLGVLITVAFLCYREYDGIAEEYGFGAPGPLGYAAGLALMLSSADEWLLLAALALIASIMVMRAEDLGKSLPRAALLVTGVIYIFGTWKCAIPLHRISPHWLMYALLLNWAGDSGAYYIGRKFGSHKLAPRVSPNKSWEGSAASVATSVLVAGTYVWYFVGGISIPHIVVLTAAANIAGQFGDLAESAMKRGAGVKDSGSILPGHGGFLDRVDSTLFALPVIYAWLKFIR
jgi:phosphatidate cytidylyltransferase